MGATPRTFQDQLSDMLLRIGLVERRQAVSTINAKTSGTTAERNDYYTPPTNDAERVTLANKQVRWLNTATGWVESFYAPVGLTGLTAPGLVTGAASGWYPVGRADTMFICKTNTFQGLGTAAQNTLINGFTVREDKGDITFASERMTVPRAGRYRITAKVYVTGGQFSLSFGFNVSGTSPDLNSAARMTPSVLVVTTPATYDESHDMNGDALLMSGDALGLASFVNTIVVGSANVWGDTNNWGWGTNVRLTYEGPPLA